MNLILSILQPASAVLLALLILIQNRGAGLSTTFGGGGGFYSTKRGAERILALSTVVMTVVFLVLSFLASVV